MEVAEAAEDSPVVQAVMVSRHLQVIASKGVVRIAGHIILRQKGNHTIDGHLII